MKGTRERLTASNRVAGYDQNEVIWRLLRVGKRVTQVGSSNACL